MSTPKPSTPKPSKVFPCESAPADHTREQTTDMLHNQADVTQADPTLPGDEMNQAPTPTAQTLPDLWQWLANQFGDRLALRDPHQKPALELSFKQLYEEAAAFAKGLQALGVKPGDRIAIFSENSPTWMIADAGTMIAGAANAPRSSVADASELAYIVSHSGSRIIIVESAKTWEKVQPELDESISLERIILLSDETHEDCLTLKQVQTLGLSHRWQDPKVTPKHLATLIYTSGTTGKPKGVMLSQKNLMHQVNALRQVMRMDVGDCMLSILPTWHAYERSGEYFVLSQGVTIVYTSPRYIKKDLKNEQPQFLIAVPRIWEMLYDGIQKQLREAKGSQKQIAERLMALSDHYISQRRIAQNKSINHYSSSGLQKATALIQAILLAPIHALADRLIYSKIRAEIAPALRFASTGGGAIPNHIDHFFELIGVQLLNGYGLTETSPVLAARTPDNNVRGSVGRAIPETEILIVDPKHRQPLAQGEVGLVYARGPQVMSGYYNNAFATEKVLSKEGWFNTEDLGWLTPEGDLVLTGRAKDTIVLRNGENIEPVPLEDVCSRSPYIDQIVVVGQDQKRLGALIVPNEEAIADWAKASGNGVAELEGNTLVTHEKVLALIAAELKARVRDRPGYRADDTIAEFRIVPEGFTVENGLMTQTLKIKRKQVSDRYADLIADMYTDA